mmetsp:Transcript_6626/g.19066  ORF Transcript_6626/g.19066 Transcript_6626/m.19066 type:complete len:501 (-) Transcript_6626:161-1663(-)
MIMGMLCSRKKASSHSTLSRSKWLVGSSSNKTFGSFSRTLPSPIRIFQPPEKLATRSSASSSLKPIRSMVFLTLLSNTYTSLSSACCCRSCIRSRISCICSGLASDMVSSRRSASLRSSTIWFSAAKTLMNSSLRVRSLTSSSTNSCRSMAVRRSPDDLTTSPVVGSSSPDMMRSCVVFPAPFFPTRPMRSPDWTPHVTSLRTSWFRKVIPTSSMRSETYPGWAPSMTRIRGGGRSLRILSSSVSLAGFSTTGSAGAATASPSKPSPSPSPPAAAAAFFSAFFFALAAIFSSFFFRALSSFFESLGLSSSSAEEAGAAASSISSSRALASIFSFLLMGLAAAGAGAPAFSSAAASLASAAAAAAASFFFCFSSAFNSFLDMGASSASRASRASSAAALAFPFFFLAKRTRTLSIVSPLSLGRIVGSGSSSRSDADRSAIWICCGAVARKLWLLRGTKASDTTQNNAAEKICLPENLMLLSGRSGACYFCCFYPRSVLFSY